MIIVHLLEAPKVDPCRFMGRTGYFVMLGMKRLPGALQLSLCVFHSISNPASSLLFPLQDLLL